MNEEKKPQNGLSKKIIPKPSPIICEGTAMTIYSRGFFKKTNKGVYASGSSPKELAINIHHIENSEGKPLK